MGFALGFDTLAATRKFRPSIPANGGGESKERTMGNDRSSVKQWLALLVCGAALALGGGARAMVAPLETHFGGPRIPCVDMRVPVPGPAAGAIELSFTSPTSGTVRLPGGRIAHIVPADF
jgi:hypothetical protein